MDQDLFSKSTPGVKVLRRVMQRMQPMITAVDAALATRPLEAAACPRVEAGATSGGAPAPVRVSRTNLPDLPYYPNPRSRAVHRAPGDTLAKVS